MKLLPLRSNGTPMEKTLPFSVYTVGTDHQAPILRLNGYSAHQFLLTFSGSGKFRRLRQGPEKWDTLTSGSLLYTPAGLAHEYKSADDGSAWHVGYITYATANGLPLADWGFGKEPFIAPLKDPSRLFRLIGRIWRISGPDYDLWKTNEALASFLIELKKQLPARLPSGPFDSSAPSGRPSRAVVDRAVTFMTDHIERSMSIEEIASHCGYSRKQLTRLFLQELGTSPQQYRQELRLQSAKSLLSEYPGMTIRQIAAHIGMEPDYFGRFFHEREGMTPIRFRLGRQPAQPVQPAESISSYQGEPSAPEPERPGSMPPAPPRST